MRLTPRDEDRLTIFVAAELARKRQARGLKLNVPEATALIADTFCEAARDGVTLAEASAEAEAVLGPDDVLEGVAAVLNHIEVEAAFEDGSRLAVLVNPITDGSPITDDHAPGAVVVGEAPLPSPDNDGKDRVTLKVVNQGPVVIGVTSHWHFFEANPRLEFDRAATYGRHLDIPAGGSVRFQPGVSTTVTLVPIAGERITIGFAGLVDGPLDTPGTRDLAIKRARQLGYRGA